MAFILTMIKRQKDNGTKTPKRIRAFKLKYTDKIEVFNDIYTIRSVRPDKDDKDFLMITLTNGMMFDTPADEFYNVINR